LSVLWNMPALINTSEPETTITIQMINGPSHVRWRARGRSAYWWIGMPVPGCVSGNLRVILSSSSSGSLTAGNWRVARAGTSLPEGSSGMGLWL